MLYGLSTVRLLGYGECSGRDAGTKRLINAETRFLESGCALANNPHQCGKSELTKRDANAKLLLQSYADHYSEARACVVGGVTSPFVSVL
jgi:hypothetical protein